MPIAMAVLAQAASAAPIDDVVVVGSRVSFKISMRALRAAQSAFASHRAAFAPNSTLTFPVERTKRATGHASPRLYVSDGDHRTPIDIGPDNSFTLPAMPAGKWWLTANLRPQAIRITPLVLSTGSTRREFRLGDARLECRVTWAMGKASVSVLASPLIGMIDAAGPCTNRKIGFYLLAPAPVRTAILAEGSRTLPITVSTNRREYRLPVSDSTLSNEARIRLATD